VCVAPGPSEALALLEAYPARPRVVEGYLPNDFTVICERTDRPAELPGA